MRPRIDWIRRRLMPALVTASGVALLAAGLLSYQDPPEAVAIAAAPTPLSSEPAGPSLPPLATLGPSGTPAASPGTAADRIPTRVVISALRVDLPVVTPPDDPDHFPYCNVAEYIPVLSRPGRPGATYVYAHARTGMFLPLLETDDRALLGMLVELYTSDDQVFLYEITQVLRHQSSLSVAFAATDEQLMLQTSEGPRGTIGKTIVVARPLSVGPADPGQAKPPAKPVVCE